MDYITEIIKSIKPIKTIFSFYVVLYFFPAALFSSIGYQALQNLFIAETQKVNFDAACILAITIILILAWTLFFILYFTNQRTKNPHLYQKGFMKDFNVKEK